MTTFEFIANPLQIFRFSPTLDGAVYAATIEWNLFGERYYLVLRNQSNEQVLSVPLIGSPDYKDINLVGGYFTSTLVYRTNSNQFEVSP